MNQDVAVVGLDLAKRVFQVHAIGAKGAMVAKRKLRRSEVLPFFSSLPGTDSMGRHDTEGSLRGLNGIPSAGPHAALGWCKGAEW